VNEDCLTLTIYFGERRRHAHELLSDALLDVFQRHELEAAVLLRGTEGFGLRHTLHTQRLLTLSEDLPLVSVAVDTREKIERALPEVTAMVDKGLVTLERARLLSGRVAPVALRGRLDEATKLTVYCGRTERSGSRPAYRAVVELLHDRGVAGATAFLGLDGMRHGVRQRARFLSRNEDVPVMIVSVGDGATIAAALPEVAGLLPRPLLTLERVQVCKRDGVVLSEPRALPEVDDAGLGIWQKLMVYAGEQARHETHSLYIALIRRLREEGAAGATALRGIWGYSGDHRPHGETLLSLSRTVPVVTVLVDRPERMQRWWAVVDELTDEAGLVTSELVPAFRAVGPEARSGGLTLAGPRP
jgi:PII-like signaling protein